MIKRKSNIIRPSEMQWPADWDISVNGISQSLWGSWAKCNRLFLMKINGYTSYDNKEKFNFGNLVHEVNDKVYTKGTYPLKKEILTHIDDYVNMELATDKPISEQILENDAAKAEATLVPYFEFYKKDFAKLKFYDAEELFKTVYDKILMRGKIDAKYKDKLIKKWMMEHKTMGQINEGTLLDYLSLDFQNLYYLLADEIQTGKPAEGTLYNVIRNTSSKPKVNESLLSYKKRIQLTVEKDPEHFFKRWEVIYTKKDRDMFKTDLSLMIKDFKSKVGKPVVANRFSCRYPFPCEMLKACGKDSCEDLTKHDNLESVLYPELQEAKPVEHIKIKDVYKKLGLRKKQESKNASKKISKKVAKRKIAKRIKRKK